MTLADQTRCRYWCPGCTSMKHDRRWHISKKFRTLKIDRKWETLHDSWLAMRPKDRV